MNDCILIAISETHVHKTHSTVEGAQTAIGEFSMK